MGWVAGLRGGAVQHGTDASQQHSRPEEDDVTPWPGTEGQSGEPPNPLTAQPQPQSWAPGSPWTTPPQSYGSSFSRDLSIPAEPKRWRLSFIKNDRWKGHAGKPEYATQEKAQKVRLI